MWFERWMWKVREKENIEDALNNRIRNSIMDGDYCVTRDYGTGRAGKILSSAECLLEAGDTRLIIIVSSFVYINFTNGSMYKTVKRNNIIVTISGPNVVSERKASIQ